MYVDGDFDAVKCGVRHQPHLITFWLSVSSVSAFLCDCGSPSSTAPQGETMFFDSLDGDAIKALTYRGGTYTSNPCHYVFPGMFLERLRVCSCRAGCGV